MSINLDLIDQLLKDYKQRENVMGENGPGQSFWIGTGQEIRLQTAVNKIVSVELYSA